MSETPEPSETSDPPRPQHRSLRTAGRREMKTRMIAELAAGETVIAAAEAAGIGWRRAYVWRAEDREFRAAWDQARAQVAQRPTVVPLPVPFTPREPDPAPFDVPPSPPRVAPEPSIWCVDVPANGFSDYDPELAEPGDKIVCILWSFSRDTPDTIVTYTQRDDGMWTQDATPDLRAYELVKPRADERPVCGEKRARAPSPDGAAAGAGAEGYRRAPGAGDLPSDSSSSR